MSTLARAFAISDHALDSGVHVVEVAGDLDVLVAPELRETLVRLIEAGSVSLLVDLTDTTFIDSTAIGVLYGRLNELDSGGGSLALLCPDPGILHTFQTAAMDRAFAIFASLDDFHAGRRVL